MKKVKHKHPRLLALGPLIIIAVLILGLLFWSATSIRQDRAEDRYQLTAAEVTEYCNSLFEEDGTARENTTKEDLDTCGGRLANISEHDTAEVGTIAALQSQINATLDYWDWLSAADEWLDDNGIVKDSLQEKDLAALTEQVKALSSAYQPLATKKLEPLASEYSKMAAAISAVNQLFTSEDRSTVRTNARRAEYNSAKDAVDALSQAGLKQDLSNSLAEALKSIAEQERIAREKAEAARRAEEERQKKIAAAWVKLNPPYINQAAANIFNGCEVASLLMALQYKGYAKNETIYSLTEKIPKTDNPNTGFYLDIYNLEPRTEAHWIAPAPLANFGASISGASISNASGRSIDQLDAEVAAGNPVIIYLTYGFNNPKEYGPHGVPKNLHVLVLAGYNSITGDQYFLDPWPPRGNAYPTLSKARTEALYAASGHRALVVR